jgi:ribonucleotide monophosphatase NagD (HAD superfamily)
VFVQPYHAVETLEEFKAEVLNLDQEVGAVVVDFDVNINYIKMMKAVLHLKDPECLFVVGTGDLFIPVEDATLIGRFCVLVIICHVFYFILFYFNSTNPKGHKNHWV